MFVIFVRETLPGGGLGVVLALHGPYDTESEARKIQSRLNAERSDQRHFVMPLSDAPARNVLRELRAAVETLPKTAGAIADFLKMKNIKGTSIATSCPIARYLESVIGEPVGAAGSTIQVVNNPDTYVETPPAVSEFIRVFDLSPQLREPLHGALPMTGVNG